MSSLAHLLFGLLAISYFLICYTNNEKCKVLFATNLVPLLLCLCS
jgi:hypothetical protein